ncbi:hypothetical protein [Halomonas huangheensis]|uniref:DNA replication terminus site-binding protein n=1 Tax=Halomonas huangheensis TaxID=1178482 RepID=W1NCL5_9GAMM|nr:hypothetical protein [Halomonas huangheensis]ALM52777.1 DNA replication terminus site-binding protein [Halomonas huangheensis]ERL52680.1 hypothetical protein BJB45_15485 [Halomonas huangheensis]
MTDDTSYRLLAELEHCFDHIIEGVERLVDYWSTADLPGWAFNADHANADWLRQALLDVWYQDGQDGRSTSSHVGIIGADETTMRLVEELNTLKERFARIAAEIRQQNPQRISELKAILPFRHPHLHTHLKGSGLARLHLKQCWRSIPLADAPLTRVRLAWYSSGRSITRLSVAEAEKRLLALDSDAVHVRIQLQRLAGIPASEPLAQVQRQAPLMRANLFYREPLKDGRTRRAMNVALPLFVPCPDKRLPDHNMPPLRPPSERQRARRSDERLEEDPFLPSLRIFRYRSY